METPTLICAATGLMAIIILPSVSRFKRLRKRLHHQKTDELPPSSRVAEKLTWQSKNANV